MLGLGKLLLIAAWLQLNPVTIPTMPAPTPVPTTSPAISPPQALDHMVGRAVYYDPGVMESAGLAACRNRGVDGWQFAWKIQCTKGGYPLGVGMSSPWYKIGAWATVCGVRSGVCRELQVVDVSGPADIAHHRAAGHVAELSYEASAAICGDGVTPANCQAEVFLWSKP